jgi:hypothetical protein
METDKILTKQEAKEYSDNCARKRWLQCPFTEFSDWTYMYSELNSDIKLIINWIDVLSSKKAKSVKYFINWDYRFKNEWKVAISWKATQKTVEHLIIKWIDVFSASILDENKQYQFPELYKYNFSTHQWVVQSKYIVNFKLKWGWNKTYYQLLLIDGKNVLKWMNVKNLQNFWDKIQPFEWLKNSYAYILDSSVDNFRNIIIDWKKIFWVKDKIETVFFSEKDKIINYWYVGTYHWRNTISLENNKILINWKKYLSNFFKKF